MLTPLGCLSGVVTFCRRVGRAGRRRSRSVRQAGGRAAGPCTADIDYPRTGWPDSPRVVISPRGRPAGPVEGGLGARGRRARREGRRAEEGRGGCNGHECGHEGMRAGATACARITSDCGRTLFGISHSLCTKHRLSKQKTSGALGCSHLGLWPLHHPYSKQIAAITSGCGHCTSLIQK